MARVVCSLEAMDLARISIDDAEVWVSYLYGLCIEFEAIFSNQELLNVLALISLQLNHLSHLTVVDDRAIASELLLDHLEDLLLVEFLGQALDCGQSLATITLCNRESATPL